MQAEIEIGDGLPDIRLTTKCLEALKQAGFEVSISDYEPSLLPNAFNISTSKYCYRLRWIKIIWEKDLAKESPVPWYLPLDKNHFSLSSFRLTAVGRFITRNMVKKTCSDSSAKFHQLL